MNVWDVNTLTGGEKGSAVKIREYETKGSFGMSIDLVSLETLPAASIILTFSVIQWRTHGFWTCKWLNTSFQQQHRTSRSLSTRPDQAGTDGRLLSGLQIPSCCWRCAGHCSVRCSERRTSRKFDRQRELDHEPGLESQWRIPPQWVSQPA